LKWRIASRLDVGCLVKKGFAEVNGTRLYYEIVGRGHPIVLVHGFSSNVKNWDNQLEVFAKHFKVMRYDMCGFGKSALPTVGKEYSHTKDLKALLNQLGIDHACIVGSSMGGFIALDFTLEYPEMTKALILVSSGLGGFEGWSKTHLEHWHAIQKEAKEKGAEAAKDLLTETPSFRKLAREKPNVALRYKQVISEYSGWHFVNIDPCRYIDPPAIERLQEISVPTLIIVGENDSQDFHRIATILDKKIQNSKSIIIKGAGHIPQISNPSEFNEAVLSFLANV
jgi:pimeloyl-ACP methyl ester carboxylesterase